VTDRDLWDKGVAAVAGAYAALDEAVRGRVREQAAAIRRGKESLHGVVARTDGEAVCAACAGACCASGKYHVRAADLLIHLAADLQLPMPRFDSGACPWLGEAGCRMPPSFRPLTCIIFICDPIEARLAPGGQEECRRQEQALRIFCREIEGHIDNRLRGPLLGVGERKMAEWRDSASCPPA
jgi:hypothetical protein